MSAYEAKKTGEIPVALALGHIGGSVASTKVTAFFSSRDHDVIQAAVRSAGKLDTPLDIKSLNKLMNDKKTAEPLRTEIIHTYRKRKLTEAKPALEKLLSERNNSLSYAAAWALAEIGLDEKETNRLASIADKGNIETKLAVLKCFVMGGAKGNPLAAISSLKNKQNDNVRMAACNVLINFPDPKAKTDLTKTFNSDRSKFVRYYAALALGMMKDEDVAKDMANQVKNSKDLSTVAKASEAVGVSKQSSAVETMVDAIKASDKEEITLLAGMGLAEASLFEGATSLLGLLNDNDHRVRCNAAMALRYFPTSSVIIGLIGQFDRDFARPKRNRLRNIVWSFLGHSKG